MEKKVEERPWDVFCVVIKNGDMVIGPFEKKEDAEKYLTDSSEGIVRLLVSPYTATFREKRRKRTVGEILRDLFGNF